MTSEAQPQLQTQVKKKDRGTTALLLMAAIVAVAGVAFAIGRLTAPAAAAAANDPSAAFRNFPRVSGSFAPGGGAFRGGGLNGGVEGTVESVNGSTMTVKLANGTTVTVDLGANTTYHTASAATASQVTAGSNVVVTIDTSGFGQGGTQPNPGASFVPGAANRTITAKDVIVVP